jgi:hypothetical protein
MWQGVEATGGTVKLGLGQGCIAQHRAYGVLQREILPKFEIFFFILCLLRMRVVEQVLPALSRPHQPPEQTVTVMELEAWWAEGVGVQPSKDYAPTEQRGAVFCCMHSTVGVGMRD